MNLFTVIYPDTRDEMKEKLDLSLVRVRMLRASSYVTPISDSLLTDTSWSPT